MCSHHSRALGKAHISSKTDNGTDEDQESDTSTSSKCLQQQRVLKNKAHHDASAATQEASHELDSSELPWYQDAIFQRYWNHYANVQLWFQRHTEYLNSLCSATSNQRYLEEWHRSQASYHVYMAEAVRYKCSMKSTDADDDRDRYGQPLWTNYSNIDSRERRQSSAHHRSRASKRRYHTSYRSPRHHQHEHHSQDKRQNIEVQFSNFDPHNGDLDIAGAVDGSFEFEMEITKEMLDFFSQSAKHRMERDSKRNSPTLRRSALNEDDAYVELSQASAGKNRATAVPPSERPGSRRIAEMKELYGAGTAMIHGMETAIQLSYDRNYDRKQPRLWPALPINIKFN